MSVVSALSDNYAMLIERFSLAIWNRHKGIVAIVITVCVANVSLLLLGEISPVSESPSR
jgi:hypothetical protein